MRMTMRPLGRMVGATLVSILTAATSIHARGAPPPRARAAALDDSLSSPATSIHARSVGLESGRNLLHSCGDHRLDLSLQRGLKVYRGKQLVLRVDLFNALNALIFNTRNTTVQFTNPSDQMITNSQYVSSGNVDPARLQPYNAGFGATTGALGMRSVQAQLRLKF